MFLIFCLFDDKHINRCEDIFRGRTFDCRYDLNECKWTLKILRWSDYPALLAKAQCGQKGPYKGKRELGESKSERDVRTEAEIGVI